jgi:hypothetical protein
LLVLELSVTRFNLRRVAHVPNMPHRAIPGGETEKRCPVDLLAYHMKPENQLGTVLVMKIEPAPSSLKGSG